MRYCFNDVINWNCIITLYLALSTVHTLFNEISHNYSFIDSSPSFKEFNNCQQQAKQSAFIIPYSPKIITFIQ